MKYIKLKEEIILLDNIYQILKDEKERVIKINYIIEGRLINYELDYSETKDNVNEEKTILQKDFEKLEFALEVKELDLVEREKYNQLIKEYDLMTNDRNNLYIKLFDIKSIIRKKKTNKTKIEEIKEILE